MSNVFQNGERVQVTSGINRGRKGTIVGVTRGDDDQVYIEVRLDEMIVEHLFRDSCLMRDPSPQEPSER